MKAVVAIVVLGIVVAAASLPPGARAQGVDPWQNQQRLADAALQSAPRQSARRSP